MGLFNGSFAQLREILTDMLYCACVILASELSKLWEPIIYRKRDQIILLWICAFVREVLSFWLQTELILHYLGHSKQQFIII